MSRSRRKGEMREGELIGWIRSRVSCAPLDVPIGPGDDTALVNVPGKGVLFAIDTIAEGVDFELETATAKGIGRKALAINLSDIAAMGATALFCVASVVLREGLGKVFSKDLYLGLESAAKKFSCPLVGGDVTGWGGGVVVTVAVIGAATGGAIRRSGAKPGDMVLVTGTLGGSLAGKHLKFTPRLAEAQWLARHCRPSAMIDISDGLGVDAGHIAAESGVSLHINGGKIPVSAAARKRGKSSGRTALEHAVSDGEDFELLFTLPEQKARDCIERRPFRTRVSVIGRVEKGEGAWLVDPQGSERRIDGEGYEHLR